MADAPVSFDYVAINPAGQRIKGLVAAPNDTAAFERLKRDGLSPAKLSVARAGKAASGRGDALSDRDCAEFLSSLGVLLRAGADMRSALSILGSRGEKTALRDLCRRLGAQIGGGEALDQAFARNLPKRHDFVAALVGAGEAASDLAGGFERAAEMINSRIKLRDQLVSVISYPAFVFVSAIAALLVILLFIVPSLAPLAEDSGARPPLSMAILIAASTFFRSNLLAIVVVTAGVMMSLIGAWLLGLLARPLDRLVMDGPASRTAGALTFGAYAIALGNMLAAGAPMTDALRLATRSVSSPLARIRLENAVQAVRQGSPLSSALERAKGFPASITRLAAVGEASGSLGTMLAKAGKIEEDNALRNIEAIGRLLGPALIVLLGGLIGLLMAGLLSGVSQLGQAALR